MIQQVGRKHAQAQKKKLAFSTPTALVAAVTNFALKTRPLLPVCHQVLLVVLGSLATATPYLALILFAIIAAWMRAAKSLSVDFENAMELDEGGCISDDDGNMVPTSRC